MPSGVCAMSVILVSVEAGDSASTWSTGSSSANFALRRFQHQFAREIELVVLHERLPDRQPLRLEKCVSHRAADQHRVGELHQILHHFDFVGNFRAAQHGDKRPIGIRNRLAEIRELFFHQQARRSLPDEFRNAHHGRMRAMRRAESVANEKPVAQRGELL